MAKPRKISAHEAQAVAALITAIATCEETLTLSVEEIGVLDDPDPELGQALGKLVRMGEYGDCWAFEVALEEDEDAGLESPDEVDPRAALTKARETISFLSSAVNRGEEWSETCEKMLTKIDLALQGL